MTTKAKLYIAIMTALAAVILAVAGSQWNAKNFGHFVVFFALAMVGSAMKIRLPGFKTTISTNFVFILIGIALFSFGETVLIGLGGALVQSFWKTQQRPKPVQALFNAACLTVCTAAAFFCLAQCPGDAGFEFSRGDDGPGSLRLRGAKHRTGLAGHLAGRGTPAKRDVVLLL